MYLCTPITTVTGVFVHLTDPDAVSNKELKAACGCFGFYFLANRDDRSHAPMCQVCIDRWETYLRRTESRFQEVMDKFGRERTPLDVAVPQ